MGKQVQCPECRQTFTAAVPHEVEHLTATPAPAPQPPRWERDHDDVGLPDRQDDGGFDGDERRGQGHDVRARRKFYSPHRGGLILAFGIVSLVSGVALVGIIFGILAWSMGSSDLAEMRAGRMDPEGEGMTQAGRIMGMIATILFLVGMVAFFGFFGCFFLMGVVGAAGAARQPRRR